MEEKTFPWWNKVYYLFTMLKDPVSITSDRDLQHIIHALSGASVNMIKYAKVLMIILLYICIEHSSLQSTYIHKLIWLYMSFNLSTVDIRYACYLDKRSHVLKRLRAWYLEPNVWFGILALPLTRYVILSTLLSITVIQFHHL